MISRHVYKTAARSSPVHTIAADLCPTSPPANRLPVALVSGKIQVQVKQIPCPQKRRGSREKKNLSDGHPPYQEKSQLPCFAIP
jgi:hypothetical protein